MRERYIAPAIMLIAGAIISVLNIIDKVPVLDGLIRLLVILIIFYILGRIMTMVIRKATTIKEIDEVTEEVIKTEDSIESEYIATDEEATHKDQKLV